jgi:hypothetical protein
VRYQQDLQVAIRERLRKLMVAHHQDIEREIRYVADWIADQPALRAILTAAERVEPDLNFSAWNQNLMQRRIEWPTSTEAGRASLIWQLLQHIAEANRVGPDDPTSPYVFAFGGNLSDATRELVERVISPLFDYLSEQVGLESNTLYVLERYVRRVEWFDRAELYDRYQANTGRGEEVYDTDLRRFLFSEGINMPFSQTKSASGHSDVITDLDTDDPFIGEVKLFDAVNHGKRELAGGLHQALQYALDWGKSTGYLIIVNLSGRPLNLPSDGPPEIRPPYLDVGGVRVYLLAVRALPPTASASKLGKANPVTVSRDDLLNPGIDDTD